MVKYLVGVWWTEVMLKSASYVVEAASEAEARTEIEDQFSDGVLELVADYIDPTREVSNFEISEVTLAPD